MQNLSPTLLTAKAKYSHGVTLMELLVAMVILAIIVASVYVAFNSGKQSWQVGETIVQKYQNARGALDMMSREISAMYLVTQNIYKTGLIYESGEFRFVASIDSDSHSGSWDLCKVGYQYYENDDDGDGQIEISEKRIQRGFDPDPDLSDDIVISSSNWQPLVSNINSLEFKCWDENNNEHDEWDSTDPTKEYWELPKAVEITIRVQDDKQIAEEREFKTVVYIPETH